MSSILTGMILRVKNYRKLRSIAAFPIYYHELISAHQLDHPVWRFVSGIFKGGFEGSYWFLYAYIGFLLMLSIIRRAVKGIEKKEIVILLVIHFVLFSLFPLINLIIRTTGLTDIYLTEDLVAPFAVLKPLFYSVLGYYIDKFVDVGAIKKSRVCGIILLGLICIFIAAFCTLRLGIMNGVCDQTYAEMFDYVLAIIAYICIKRWTSVSLPKLSQGRIASAVCLIGSLTFGIYLLDPFLRFFLMDYWSGLANQFMPTILVSIGWVIISIIIGGGITWLFKAVKSKIQTL